MLKYFLLIIRSVEEMETPDMKKELEKQKNLTE